MKRTSLPRKKIDPSVPREMFWFSKTSNKGFCPKCNSKLENEYQSYSLLTKQKKEIEELIVGCKAGYFCPNCSVVVLKRKSFVELLSYESPPVSKFAVVGLVDIDMIPKGKRHLPIGTPENPTPVVRFIHPAQDKKTAPVKRTSKKNSQSTRKTSGRRRK